MAQLFGFDIPYMAYIGSGVGLVIGAIILWSVLRSRGESRIDIANEEISRDEELLQLHRREKKIEKQSAQMQRNFLTYLIKFIRELY